MTAPSPRLKYRPELDGVRAVAVLAVLLFHLVAFSTKFNWIAKGGFLGVDIFFVLSGMLITELLVADREKSQREALGSFYVRRARRLVPAATAMLVIAVVYYQVEFHAARETVKGLLSLVAFVTIGHRNGYQYPWGVTHVWTLVVEWEFYLVWPLALLYLLRRYGRPSTVGRSAFGGAVAVALAGVVVYNANGHDWTTPYFLAWLRFDELLIGCTIALIAGATTYSPPTWLRTVAPVVVLATIFTCNSDTAYLYDGGMFVVALATGAVVWPNSEGWWGQRLLSSPILVWIGKLSYSLYLWSVPVVADIDRQGKSWPAMVQVLVSVTLSFALASASYYLVERRFRMPSRRAAGAETDPVLGGVASDSR